MNRTRLQQIEGIAISGGGLVLLFEITNAVRANVWWIGLSVLREQGSLFTCGRALRWQLSS